MNQQRENIVCIGKKIASVKKIMNTPILDR